MQKSIQLNCKSPYLKRLVNWKKIKNFITILRKADKKGSLRVSKKRLRF